MCKAYPGPRCANYRRRKLKEAIIRRDKAIAGGADEKQLEQLEEKIEAAQRKYDATRSGQNELKQQIAQSEEGSQREGLQQRLDAAIEEAEHQKQWRAQERARLKEQTTNDNPERNGTDGDQGVRHFGDAPGTRAVSAFDGMGRRPAGARTSSDRGGVERLRDPHGTQPRVLSVAGHQVQAVARHEPPATRAEQLRSQGLSAPAVYELDQKGAHGFHDAIASLKEDNPYHASVSVYEAEEYEKMRLFVTENGKSGFAIANGDELVSVFSRRDSANPKCARSLVATAVSLGARRLDCYDTVLPKIYAREGFTPVARLKFDDEYAPEGWDFKVYHEHNRGRPDVVFMAYDSENVDKRYVPGSGPYVDDYDAGETEVRTFLAARS